MDPFNATKVEGYANSFWIAVIDRRRVKLSFATSAML